MLAMAVGATACAEPLSPRSGPAGGAAPADPTDAAGALTVCGERLPELAITCRVEAAARAGREGASEVVERACGSLDGRWAQECRFRAGEELARAGWLADGLAQCAQAGEFARFCVTHVGWGVPGSAAGGPDQARDASGWEALAGVLPEPLRVEAAETLRARWWFERFYGTGQADPAKAADLPEARGAWALEAVRLAGGRDAAAAAWASGAVLTGEALPRDRRVGRYDTMLLPEERALPRVRTFGGGTRIVGETAAEDLDIALLEALFFQERTDGAPFAAWIEDPRPRVRYTALRLYRTLHSEGVEARLNGMAGDPDPVVRAHVADALEHRTWLGKGKGAPGPAR